jgi:hypothetical protein
MNCSRGRISVRSIVDIYMMRSKAVRYTRASMIAAVCALVLSGCQKTAAPERVNAMGAPAAVGPVNYTVEETEWRDSLESDKGPRIPKDRFLLVHVTVLNASSEQKAAPLLEVLDAKGAVHAELTEGDGVTDWMGYLRLMAPRESRSGRLLFDVPQGACKLRVSSGGDPESEQSALIDLPLQLTSEMPPAPGATGAGGVEGAPQLPQPVAPAKK